MGRLRIEGRDLQVLQFTVFSQFEIKKSQPSHEAMAGEGREGLLRDPNWGNLAPKLKSLPLLRAGGLLNLNGDFKRA